jgi:hypothetical protein
MFIARVDYTLTKKLSMESDLSCRECNSKFGLWHLDLWTSTDRIKLVCTKDLVSSVTKYLQSLEGQYISLLEILARRKALLEFITTNPTLDDWSARQHESLGYKSYNTTCFNCPHKAKTIIDNRYVCRGHAISELTSIVEERRNKTIQSYQDIVRTAAFIKELQKELEDPEYCSELLE